MQHIIRWGPAAALFVLFFAAYRWGVVLWVYDRVLGGDLVAEFWRWQQDSNSLTSARVETNLEEGIFAHELSLGIGGTYTSQFGLGGWLLSLLGSAVGGGQIGSAVMYTAVSAGNAALVVVVVLAARRALSVGGAVVVAVALLQPFPTFIAPSIYWIIGLKVLPALVLAVVLARRPLRSFGIGTLVAAGTLPALLSGYEYITVVVALPLAVVAYFGVRDGLALRLLGWRALAVVIGSMAALAAALGLHVAQLSIKMGGISAGAATLVEVVVKRTGAGSTTVPAVYGESLASNPFSVLERYLSMPVAGSPDFLADRGFVGLPSLGSVAALLVVVASVILTRPAIGAAVSEASQRRWDGLSVAWLVSLVGPIGWFLLARPHSFIHPFINPILWYIPTVPLGLALLWGPIMHGVRSLRGRPVAAVAFGGVIVAVVLFLGYSYLSQR